MGESNYYSVKILWEDMFGRSPKPTGTKLDAWNQGMGIAVYALVGWRVSAWFEHLGHQT